MTAQGVSGYRTDPYRVFFPLGLLCGISGIVHWLLFSLGYGAWNVPLHVALQFPAYVGCVVAGFLGTALPRITETPHWSRTEFTLFLLLGAALAVVPAFEQIILPKVCFTLFVLTLASFVISRHRRAKRFPAPLYWAYFAIFSALLGISFDIAASFGIPLPSGRPLWTQGFILPLILATAPLIGRRIIGATAVPAKISPSIIAVPAALLALSLGLELSSPSMNALRAAYVLRALLILLLIRKAKLSALWGTGHAQPRLFLTSLVAMVMSFLLVGIFPAHRTTLLHIAFIGGFSLLILSVAYRVVIFHGPNQALYDRLSPTLWIMGLLLISATVLRVSANFFPEAYLATIEAASILWILAHLIMIGIIIAAGRHPAALRNSEATS